MGDVVSPFGVTSDGSGSLYISGANPVPAIEVVKLPWTGTSYGAPITITTDLTFPYSVAVDASGNVYSADLNLNLSGDGAGANGSSSSNNSLFSFSGRVLKVP